MIKATPEILAELKRQGVKIIDITLEDLAKAKPCSSLGIFIKK